MQTYRIGIVGAGFGVKAHLPALIAHPRFDVVALASPHSAARVAADRGIPHAFASCRDMLAGCELDAVAVTSPPFAHLDDVTACFAAGKHVVCEKPFALDVAGAQAMIDANRAAGTAAGIVHEFRFSPQMQALKELVDNGHLDPLRDMEITALQSFVRSGARPRGWWFEPSRGGGTAGAMLSHAIDLANWLCDRAPQRTVGFRRNATPQRTDESGPFASSVDDGAFALNDYGEGLVARLCADSATSADGFTCALHGEKRTAVASGLSPAELTLFSIDADETSELECKPSPYERFAIVNRNVPLLMEFYDQFAAKIDGLPNALPSFEDALMTQRVLAAIGYPHPPEA
jgi:predicted dehydrogenase